MGPLVICSVIRCNVLHFFVFSGCAFNNSVWYVLCVCVCKCVCVCVCVCACVCVCVSVCLLCSFTHDCQLLQSYWDTHIISHNRCVFSLCVSVWVFECLSVCVSVCVWVCACACVKAIDPMPIFHDIISPCGLISTLVIVCLLFLMILLLCATCVFLPRVLHIRGHLKHSCIYSVC